MVKKIRHHTSRKHLSKKTLFTFVLLFIFAFSLGSILWYQSRAIPEPGKDDEITVLPPEFQHVLGTKISPSISPAASIRIPIFLYHYVEYVHNDPGRQNLNIPPNVLTSQIETLKNAGYSFITPSDVTDALSGKTKLAQKVIMLSFDDGYMDLYTDVFPILRQEQVKAVAYIVPDFLNRPNYLFSFQLQELAKSPLVEIGAHTMDHVWLKGQSQPTVQYQVLQSRKVLQDILHLPITSFAYPYGAFDQQTIDEVTQAGFTNAVSTVPGIVQTQQNRYYLYRLRPGYRSGQTLVTFLQQDTFRPW